MLSCLLMTLINGLHPGIEVAETFLLSALKQDKEKKYYKPPAKCFFVSKPIASSVVQTESNEEMDEHADTKFNMLGSQIQKNYRLQNSDKNDKESDEEDSNKFDNLIGYFINCF